MATLNGGITSTAELIRVTGTPPTPGAYFTVGSESIRFLGASRGPTGRSFTRDWWSVDRGVAGTTKATHSNGATLTRYYPEAEATGGGGGVTVTGSQGGSVAAMTIAMPGLVSDLGGGVAGVGLIVSQIGPFTVTPATMGVDGFGTPTSLNDGGTVDLTALPDNATVISVWIVPTTGWSGTGSSTMVLLVSIQPQDDPNGQWDIWKTALGTLASDWMGNNPSPGTFRISAQDGRAEAPPVAQVVVQSVSGAHLAVRSQAGGGADAGAADIYAIIASPAS